MENGKKPAKVAVRKYSGFFGLKEIRELVYPHSSFNRVVE
jgi:hypothetical protein